MTTPTSGDRNGSRGDAPQSDLLTASPDAIPIPRRRDWPSQQPTHLAQSLVELLQWRARHQPDRRAFTFLVDGETTAEHLTYAALDGQARAIAAHLQRETSPGDRALLIYPAGLPYIAAFFGS